MSKVTVSVITFTLVLTLIKGNAAFWKSPNNLQPVHELYVKPSDDGTTGDLYVAATEDDGIKSQWLTDQPVNFLTVPTSSPHHQPAMSVAYPAYPVPKPLDETTQKRSIVSSPPSQYTYALPVSSSPSGGNNAVVPYPYAAPPPAVTPSSTEGTPSTPCMDPARYPQYPFQYFYPHMMSAYTNAMSILKEAGLSDETASSVMTQASPMWPPTYSYPMYFMVDPNTWTQNQVISHTPASSPAVETPKENA